MEEMKEGGAQIRRSTTQKMGQEVDVSFRTARESISSQTFYEGELSWKTGTVSKTKIFGVLLKGAGSFFVIDKKLIAKVDGQIPDRLNPYGSTMWSPEAQLEADWIQFDLTKCQIEPSGGDKKCFKLLVKRDEEGKSEKEQRFFTDNVCSRNAWVKKLLQAKNNSFEANDCTDVPLEEIIALQKELDGNCQVSTVLDSQFCYQPPQNRQSLGRIDIEGSKQQQEYECQLLLDSTDAQAAAASQKKRKMSTRSFAKERAGMVERLEQIRQEIEGGASPRTITARFEEMLAITTKIDKSLKGSLCVDSDGEDVFYDCQGSADQTATRTRTTSSIAPIPTEPFSISGTVNIVKKQDIIELARNFQPVLLRDDFRAEDAHKDGGFALDDPVILAKYRGALKDLIKQVGRMIISGKFELYKVSFPIKCMSSRSILSAVAKLSLHAPTYMNAAALTTDPIQRMKLLMTFSISFCYSAHTFEKPLNPILGETYQARMEDGTEVMLEQVCHHPPISFMLLEGPNNLYRYSSYSSFSPKAHINSIDLCVKGKKEVVFQDGSSITFNPPPDSFKNTLWGGSMVHQITGRVDFEDTKNGLTAFYEIGDGGVRKNPKDYLKGSIMRTDGTVVSQVYGNYMGYVDFDGERFWDVREQINYIPVDISKNEKAIEGGKLPLVLSSDTTYRQDSITLEAGDVELAQEKKNQMEEAQRHDRKLREVVEKRRSNGGPKISLQVQRE